MLRAVLASTTLLAMATLAARATEPAIGEDLAIPSFSKVPEQAGCREISCCEFPTAPTCGNVIAEVDYVLWWLREGRVPATLTTSSPSSQGLLGQPDTQTIYGDDRLQTRHGDQFNGIRAYVAWYADDAHSFGLEADAFFLERDSTYFKSTSDGSILLARPYFTTDGQPASYIVAGPSPNGLLRGGFVGYSRVELFGQEANSVFRLVRRDWGSLDLLLGARFLQMRDRTDLNAVSYSLPDNKNLYGMDEHYRTHNAYYGGQLGLRNELRQGRWILDTQAEVGLGGDFQSVRSFANTIVQSPLQRISTPTGLIEKLSNIGDFGRTAVNLVTEIDCTVGYQLTSHIELRAGYTLLLWDGPVRSGDQIDLVVNPHPGTGPVRPEIPFKQDVFWAQGVNLGARFQW